MILAGICSALFSLAMPTAMAEGGACQSIMDAENPAQEVEKQAEGMAATDLDSCFNNVADKMIDASTNADTTVYDKMNKALEALSTAILSKQASLPTEEYVKTLDPPVTDISAPGNLCICAPTSENASTCTDANNIIAVVEEPLETELTETDQKTVRTCTRNTFCVEREEGKEMKCVTYLNATKSGDDYKPFCSDDAQKHIEANPGKASLYCQPVQVFLSSTGTDLLFIYISTIYRWAASVIGIIAVLVVVISGIQISAAAGDQQAVTNAKNRIIQSLGGLALLFLSAIILYTINPTFFTAGQ